jgi:hypothetical protein
VKAVLLGMADWLLNRQMLRLIILKHTGYWVLEERRKEAKDALVEFL